jgi:hypothetical protein
MIFCSEQELNLSGEYLTNKTETAGFLVIEFIY